LKVESKERKPACRLEAVQRFTDLTVWRRSHALVSHIDKLTRESPNDERFNLVSQIRRAALSVPTNIAEGSKRIGRSDYARFLNIAEGSLAETEYLLMVGRDLGYIAVNSNIGPQKEIEEISKMLHGLRKAVEGDR
jgi:four helix bundle protein